MLNAYISFSLSSSHSHRCNLSFDNLFDVDLPLELHFSLSLSLSLPKIKNPFFTRMYAYYSLEGNVLYTIYFSWKEFSQSIESCSIMIVSKYHSINRNVIFNINSIQLFVAWQNSLFIFICLKHRVLLGGLFDLVIFKFQRNY